MASDRAKIEAYEAGIEHTDAARQWLQKNAPAGYTGMHVVQALLLEAQRLHYIVKDIRQRLEVEP